MLSFCRAGCYFVPFYWGFDAFFLSPAAAGVLDFEAHKKGVVIFSSVPPCTARTRHC